MNKNIFIGGLVVVLIASGLFYTYNKGIARAEIRGLKEDLADIKSQQKDKNAEIAELKVGLIDQEKVTSGIKRDNEVLRTDIDRVRLERDEALERVVTATNSEVVETTKEILEEDSIYLRMTFVEFSFLAARNNAGKLTEWRWLKFKEIPRLATLIVGKDAQISSEVAEKALIANEVLAWMDKFDLSQREVADWRAFNKAKKKGKFWQGVGGKTLAFLAGVLFEKAIK